MRFTPGELTPKQAEELNRLVSKVDGLAQARVSGPASFTTRGGIPTFNVEVPRRILAKITGHHAKNATAGSGSGSSYSSMSCKYSFVEVYENPNDCTHPEVLGGQIGYTDAYPAVEINGGTSVPEGTIVELFLSPGGDFWNFQQGGGSGAFFPAGGAGLQCILALATQTCCDDQNGFYSRTWYFIFAPDGFLYIVFDDRTTAINMAVNDFHMSGCILGECPSIT